MWQPLLRSAVIKEHDYQVDNSLYSLVTYLFLKYGSVMCISFYMKNSENYLPFLGVYKYAADHLIIN